MYQDKNIRIIWYLPYSCLETYTRIETAWIYYRFIYEKGYCLQQAPELLNVEELKEELGDYL